MNPRIHAAAVVGTFFVALACDSSRPVTPPAAFAAGDLVLAQASSAANGNMAVIPVDFTFPQQCGTQTLSAHAVGWLQIRNFTHGSGRNLQVLAVNILFTFTNSAGATFRWREVGIDHFTVDQDGNVLHALIGRAGTPGIIGRLVFDDATGTLIFVAGNNVGNVFENACAALT